MFCQLNYHIDKELHRNIFFDNIDLAHHHKSPFSEFTFWKKYFYFGPEVQQVVNDLNLQGLNIKPRYSWQEKNTLLPLHIDKNRIIGININLMDEPAVLHINSVPYSYECALIDVGAQLHSVEPFHKDRLVLKLAIRDSWKVIWNRLNSIGMIGKPYGQYESILYNDMKKFVRI